MRDFLYRLLINDSFVGMFAQVVPVTLLAGLVYVIVRYIQVKRQGTHLSKQTEIFRALFVCYLTGLINLILVPPNLWLMIWYYLFNGFSGGGIGPLFTFNFNLVPTLLKWVMGELTIGSWVFKMLIGNFLMFVPMGFLLPFISEKLNRRNVLKLSVVIPVIVELVQPIVGRSFDVDDLILNSSGIIVGYFIAAYIRAVVSRKV